MNLAQKVAGIPIDLPGWTQVVAYTFLVLLAALIGTLIWRAIQAAKHNSHLGEIHAKTNLILLMLRNWQENGQISEDPALLRNEHYSPEPAQFHGAYRFDDPVTDEHERIR